MIKDGNIVDVHYVGRLAETGEVFYNSYNDNKTINIQVGTGQFVDGFEKSLFGKQVGDKYTITCKPEEAFGEVIEGMEVSVKLDDMPGEVQIGQVLFEQAEDGSQRNVTVKAINEDTITIDRNHPLAGKEVIFDVEVIDVK